MNPLQQLLEYGRTAPFSGHSAMPAPRSRSLWRSPPWRRSRWASLPAILNLYFQNAVDTGAGAQLPPHVHSLSVELRRELLELCGDLIPSHDRWCGEWTHRIDGYGGRQPTVQHRWSWRGSLEPFRELDGVLRRVRRGRRYSSALISTAGENTETIALLIQISIGPNVASITAAASSICPALATSTERATDVLPSASTSRRAASGPGPSVPRASSRGGHRAGRIRARLPGRRRPMLR